MKQVLVTGAAGKTGKALIAALQANPQVELHIWVRTEEQSRAFTNLGIHRIFVGDMLAQQNWLRVLESVDSLYFICPNMHPQEIEIAHLAIQSSLDTALSHLIYHSVLHPQTEEMPHHWHKLRVEECLFRTGLPFTILQPCAYMQNLDIHWTRIRKHRRWRIPYPAATVIDMIHLQDLAEAAARVITEGEPHFHATYELATGENLTQRAIADMVAAQIGAPVQIESLDRVQWEAEARNSGLSAYARRTLWAMFAYYEQYGFYGNGQVLTSLLARKPISLKQYIVQALQDQGREGRQS